MTRADGKFFNLDGSINFDTALTMGRRARREEVKVLLSRPRSGPPPARTRQVARQRDRLDLTP